MGHGEGAWARGVVAGRGYGGSGGRGRYEGDKGVGVEVERVQAGVGWCTVRGSQEGGYRLRPAYSPLFAYIEKKIKWYTNAEASAKGLLGAAAKGAPKRKTKKDKTAEEGKKSKDKES